MERKNTKLTNVVGEILRAQSPEPPIEETYKDASVAYVVNAVKALPESARKRKLNAKEMRQTRVDENRSVLGRLMGNQAQLPSGSEAVVNDTNEGRTPVQQCI